MSVTAADEQRLERLRRDDDDAARRAAHLRLRRCGHVAMPAVDGDPGSWHISSSRPYWSLISALSGLTYSTLDPGCVRCRRRGPRRGREQIGRNAASVFPPAVGAEMITSVAVTEDRIDGCGLDRAQRRHPLPWIHRWTPRCSAGVGVRG